MTPSGCSICRYRQYYLQHTIWFRKRIAAFQTRHKAGKSQDISVVKLIGLKSYEENVALKLSNDTFGGSSVNFRKGSNVLSNSRNISSMGVQICWNFQTRSPDILKYLDWHVHFSRIKIFHDSSIMSTLWNHKPDWVHSIRLLQSPNKLPHFPGEFSRALTPSYPPEGSSRAPTKPSQPPEGSFRAPTKPPGGSYQPPSRSSRAPTRPSGVPTRHSHSTGHLLAAKSRKIGELFDNELNSLVQVRQFHSNASNILQCLF